VISIEELRTTEPVTLALNLLTRPADLRGRIRFGRSAVPWTLRPAIVLRDSYGPPARLGELLFLEIEAREMASLVSVVADMARNQFVRETAALYWAASVAADNENPDIDPLELVRESVRGAQERMMAAYGQAAEYCQSHLADEPWADESEREQAAVLINRTSDYLSYRARQLSSYEDEQFERPFLFADDEAFSLWFDFPSD
jgi:hypothetical protein